VVTEHGPLKVRTHGQTERERERDPERYDADAVSADECRLEGRISSLTLLGSDVVVGCGNGVIYRLDAVTLQGRPMSVHPVATTTALAFGDTPETMWCVIPVRLSV
jgi:hypothetical protein